MLKTSAELTAVIKASGATQCHLLPGATTCYAQIAAAVRAVADAGCSMGMIGSMSP